MLFHQSNGGFPLSSMHTYDPKATFTIVGSGHLRDSTALEQYGLLLSGQRAERTGLSGWLCGICVNSLVFVCHFDTELSLRIYGSGYSIHLMK
jgi:hypothetical protein